MAPKHKPTPAPKKVAETPDDIAALATSSLATITPEPEIASPIVPPPTVLQPTIAPPSVVKEVTDTIMSAATKPAPVLPPAMPVEQIAEKARQEITKVAAAVLPTPTVARKNDEVAPAAPAKNPVTPATMKPTNEEIVTTRSILLRRLKKYAKVFKKETEDIIPANYTGLNNDQLAAICSACDASLGDCFDKDAIAVILFTALQSFEEWVLPFIPRGKQFRGVSLVAEHQMKDEESPLSRAMDRLAIKHMGKFETSAEVGLVINLWTAFRQTREWNIQQGRYDPNESERQVVHESSSSGVQYDYSNL